jgi:hypothetical protein
LKSRTQTEAAKSKSALPILKTTNLKSSSSAAAVAVVAVAAMDDRRRGHWTSLFKSPPLPQPGIPKASSTAREQQRQQTATNATLRSGLCITQDEQRRSDDTDDNLPK